jgi:CheY-like chemotaxis protein
MVQELVSAFLKKIGCRVEIASSGEQAVSAYVGAKSEGRPFDLVILDLTVPGGMGGISALRALKDVDPAVRAIVSSGYSEDPIMADPRAFGFVASLAKPYRFEQLTALLREIFG